MLLDSQSMETPPTLLAGMRSIQKTRRGPMTRHRSTRRTTSNRYHRYVTSTHSDDDDKELMIESVLGHNSNGLYQRRRDYAPLRGDDLVNDEFRDVPSSAGGPSPYSIFKVPSWLSKNKDWKLQLICMMCGVVIYMSFVTMSSGANHVKKAESALFKKDLDNFEVEPPLIETRSKLKKRILPMKQGLLRGGHSGSVLSIDFQSNDDMVIPSSLEKSRPASVFENMHDDNVEKSTSNVIVKPDVAKEKQAGVNPMEIMQSANTAAATSVTLQVRTNATIATGDVETGDGNNSDHLPLASPMVANAVNVTSNRGQNQTDVNSFEGGAVKELEAVPPNAVEIRVSETNNTIKKKAAKEILLLVPAHKVDIDQASIMRSSNVHNETLRSIAAAVTSSRNIEDASPAIVSEGEASAATGNETVPQTDQSLGQKSNESAVDKSNLNADQSVLGGATVNRTHGDKE